MAKVSIDDRQHHEFAESLVNLCKERGISLSDSSQDLLRVAAEAWLREPPTFLDNSLNNSAALRKEAERIVQLVSEESHVRAARQAHQKVPAHVWLYVLGTVGMSAVGGLIEKGL